MMYGECYTSPQSKSIRRDSSGTGSQAGLKGTAVMKLLCKMYTRKRYYLKKWNAGAMHAVHKQGGRDINEQEMQGIDILVRKPFSTPNPKEQKGVLTSTEIEHNRSHQTKKKGPPPALSCW